MQNKSPANLVDVFVLRRLAAEEEAGQQSQQHGPGSQPLESCLLLHGIVRQRCYLAADGRRILWHFRAPDAESLRMALRGARIEYDEVWTAKDKHEDKDIQDTSWRETHD
jgi:hypothetical protein